MSVENANWIAYPLEIMPEYDVFNNHSSADKHWEELLARNPQDRGFAIRSYGVQGEAASKPSENQCVASCPHLKTYMSGRYWRMCSRREGVCDSGDPTRIVDLVEHDDGGRILLRGKFAIVLTTA